MDRPMEQSGHVDMPSAETRQRLNRSAIAIIGMSGRFPGAATIEAFWRNLRDGVESRRIFTDEELIAEGMSRSGIRHPRLVRSGYPLEDIDKFDADFFGINPREAELLDPQHRLFLENAWMAMENAGYDPDTVAGPIAVFGGATLSGYLNTNVLKNANVWKTVGVRQGIFGSVPDYMVSRVAYKLNLRGPSYFVQTACSTSLVAVHLACQSLRHGECVMALAGGVSIQIPHFGGYVYEDGGMMSPDGVCRAFDANARGTVFGSGIGLVVLKRLEDAIADRDNILAVVRGSATNNDGSLKVGFTAPGIAGQAQAISEALANAEVSPDSISYVEAHGTGTELGDPIEVAALTRAYRAHTDRRAYCALGSVKPNVGHLDAAAGVSSLIKTILALQHQQLPPTINFDRPNPKIDFEDSPFVVNTTLTAWPANGEPRRAGVSSFGFGGNNAHVIVEEAPALEASGPSRTQQVLVLSARTPTALDAAAGALAEELRRQPDLDIADVAYTQHVGRRAFAHRRAIVCASTQEAFEALDGTDVRRVYNGQAATKDRPVVFLFPGQGTQYVGMGRGLYEEEPLFKEIVDDCCERLRPELGFDLREVLYPEAGPNDESADRLKRTMVTQSALFVVEYALARVWMSWGITPSACLGHSIGEFVAACVSGVLALEDALRLVALRGRLMEKMAEGVMVAVPLPESRVRTLLGEGLWLATINAPSLCVVSGEREAVGRFVERLSVEGVECRHLHTSHAFHSGMMEAAVSPFVAAVREVELHAPVIPYLSNLTGGWATEALVTDPAYWGRHLREAVRFADNVSLLLQQPDQLLLEAGPGNTLSALVRQQTKGAGKHVVVSSLRHSQETATDATTMQTALARLWVGGARVDWFGVHARERRRRVPLPSYPFERKRYWITPDKYSRGRTMRMMAQLDRPFTEWFQIPSWKRTAVPSPAQRSVDEPAETVLLLIDEKGVGRAAGDRLLAAGHHVTFVSPGEAFAEETPGTFTIDPRRAQDYGALVKALRKSNRTPTIVGHFWGVTGCADDQPDAEAMRRYQDLGFYSVLYLVQALGEAGHAAPLRLRVVTDGVQDVNSLEALVPEKATVLGPVRVTPREYPNIATQAIDLVLQEGHGVSNPDLDMLVADLLSATGDRDVAYRSGRRWVETYQLSPLQSMPAGDLPSRLKTGGVYLITGGLGGVGLVLARYLAESVKARLVLTGRRGLPAKSAWPEYLAQAGEQDPTASRIRLVQELEAAGAEVLVGAADVTDEARFAAVIEDAYARFGRIDGVIHAAGVAGAGMMQLKTPAMADAVMAPKVDGTRVLARAFQHRGLDFVVLCSSTTSILGLVGQVDYCGANAYLDAFASHHAFGRDTLAVAINWSAWRDVGMAVDTRNLRVGVGGGEDTMLQGGLSNEDGIEVFKRVLAAPPSSQVAVSHLDLGWSLEGERIEAHTVAASADDIARGERQEQAPVAGASAQLLHPRPAIQSVFVAPRNEVEIKICAVWGEMIGIEPVGVHDSFFELGGHSLLAVRVMARVNEVLGTEIPVAKLYEGLTVDFIARLAAPIAQTEAVVEEDPDAAEKRREKARRQREHQQRRRVALGR
jgi:acyl transferase domain-containing protein